MAKIKYSTFITADTESNKDGTLYLLTTYNPDLGSRIFYDLRSFYDYLNTLDNVTVFIHNLANWDAYFLFKPEIIKDYEIFNRVNKEKKLLSITFKHEVGTKNSNKQYRYINIVDSYPRTNVGLKDFAKSIGDPYNDLPDYDTHREPGKPETWLDRDLIEKYAVKDVVILWKLIEIFKGVYGDSFNKTLSAGSMVWAEMITQYCPANSRFAYLGFRQRFVSLDQNIDNLIRPSFMGGITTPFWNNGVVLDKPKLKELYPWFKNPMIVSEDISSAYAWSQIKELPHGRYDMYYAEDVDIIKRMIHRRNKIVFFAIKYKYTRAKFPLIPKLHMEEVIEYIVDGPDSTFTYNTGSQYMLTMLSGNEGIASVSSLDLRVAIENDVYENFEWEIIPFINQTHERPLWGIVFSMKKSPEMYNITMKYYDLKNNAPTKALRTAYKSPLVNLFGKTGERFYKTENELDIFEWEYEFENYLEEPIVPRYANVAVAAVITSYVHHKLYFKGKEVGFKNMLYCDTDSMFFVKEESPIVINETVLGSWDSEVYNPDRALFICPKKYITEVLKTKGFKITRPRDGKWSYKLTVKGFKRLKWASAGLLKSDSTFNITNFTNGQRVYKSRVKRLVEGGVILEDTKIDINDSFVEGETFTYDNYYVYE